MNNMYMSHLITLSKAYDGDNKLKNIKKKIKTAKLEEMKEG